MSPGLAKSGIRGAWFSGAVLQTLYVVLNYRLPVRTLFGPFLRGYLDATLPAMAFGLAMALAVAAVGWAARALPWPAALAAEVVTGAAVYGALVFAFKRRVVQELAMAAPGGAV